VKPKTIVSAHGPLSSAKDAALARALSPRAAVTPGRAPIGTLVEQVRTEYAEMPGLSVTLPQAQRLWRLDRATCEEVFSRLVARGVLKMTPKGRFVRT
jgi:hypothetical protein